MEAVFDDDTGGADAVGAPKDTVVIIFEAIPIPVFGGLLGLDLVTHAHNLSNFLGQKAG